MAAIATEAGLTQLRFVAEPRPAPCAAPMADHPVLHAVAAGLEAYAKDPHELKAHLAAVPIAPQGSAFQKRVWAEVAHIPPGQTCSYQALAHRLGQPTAVRAVANALALNPLLVWVPCHRVIGSDGNLRGYAAGLERKQALLHHEGAWPRPLSLQ